MPLPKTKHPLFETEIPSTRKKVLYRQMLVRDEKILLLAKSSEDDGDIFRAVKQVVNNCLFEDTNIDNLATFDIEFLFIKLRSASIGNEIDLAFKDLEDKLEYKFNVNIDDIGIEWPENVNPVIKVNDNTVIKLRYPPASLFDDDNAYGDDAYEYIASRCIDKIFIDEEAYDTTDASPKELLEYILDLDTKSYQQVKDFITNMPRLKYVISYTNKAGTDRKITLTTLTDFFTLR